MKAENVHQTSKTLEYLTIMIADQKFGIPVLQIQDVLREQRSRAFPSPHRRSRGRSTCGGASSRPSTCASA